MDRTLTFKQHLEGLERKLSSRINIIRKLAGSTWGADPSTLRSSVLALVYSTAEYCAPIWLNSSHTYKVDVQLNNALRVITGSLKSTPLPWLSVLANIEPAPMRREAACRKEFMKCNFFKNSILFDVIQNPPSVRLKSRNPPWCLIESDSSFDIKSKWKDQWLAATVTNKYLVDDPNEQVPGFSDLSRSEWVTLNRIRTSHGRTAYNMYMWGFKASPNCECGDIQTMEHITDDCPIFKFNGGLNELHAVSQNAKDYIKFIVSKGLNI